MNRRAFLSRVASAFRDLPDIRVVISTGEERLSQALQPVPPNVEVHNFLPQLKVLEIADLAITMGGAGTLRECIAKQIPLLVYANNHDQMGNSARVVYHGIGLRGSRRSDSENTIRKKALQILENRSAYTCNLRLMKKRVDHFESDLLSNALERAMGPAKAVRQLPKDVVHTAAPRETSAVCPEKSREVFSR